MTDPLSALTAEEQAARDRLRREVDPTYPSPYTDLVSQDKDVTSLCDACERLAQENARLKGTNAFAWREAIAEETRAENTEERLEQAEARAAQFRERLRTIIADYDERVALYGVDKTQPHRELVIERGRAALAEEPHQENVT